MEPSPDTRALGRELMDTLATGWSKARLDTILGIFADNAVLVETPFSRPITGLAEIRKWWADVPYHQSEVSCIMGEIYAAGPWFSTEFKLTFRRRRTGEWVEARGAIFCEMAGGKVTEMRMYWHRWIGGREV